MTEMVDYVSKIDRVEWRWEHSIDIYSLSSSAYHPQSSRKRLLGILDTPWTGTLLRADRFLLVRKEMDDVQLTPAQQRQAQLARLKGVSNGFDPTYTS
jgi:hypothetical protein